MVKAAAFVAHGGGPTAVLNMSLLGVYRETRRQGLSRLWAGRGGLAGVLESKVQDLLSVPSGRMERMAFAPGSIPGSFRGALAAEALERVLQFFRQHEIRFFFYTGGNGSMGTALRMSRLAEQQGYELRVVGIPKTMDNDLRRTDHCPGFGSAARFVARAVRDIGLDQRALPTPVSIIEVMGRNSGWLAAASLLARRRPDDPPHFIYCPERPFESESFLTRVDSVLCRFGWVVGVVAEGLRDATGSMLGAARGSSLDARRRPLAGNCGQALARLVSLRLKVRARSEKPGLLCRCSSCCISPVDAREALRAGEFAVRRALRGETGVMVRFLRTDSPRYRSELGLVPLSRVADLERTLPQRYLEAEGMVSRDFCEYAAPLAGPLESFPLLGH